jgi:hypothetical protein
MTCENITYLQQLPSFVRNTLRDCGLPSPISIKIRQQGLSSKGIVDYCHHNVSNMVQRYGGKRATGYVILKYPNIDQYQLLFHSAWVTPEKNIVCITKENYKMDAGHLQNVWFLELYRDDENLNLLKMYDELVIERKRMLIRSIKSNKFYNVNWVQAKRSLSQPVYTQTLSVSKYNFLENN